MRSLVAYLLLILSGGLAGAQVSSDDKVIEVVVLRQMLSAIPQRHKDVGVERSEAELKPLQTAFGSDRSLITIAAYIRRHPNPVGSEPCFWLRIDNRTPSSAVVEGGDYPLPCMTKWGPMYLYTTDYEFHLMKVKGRWVIVSSKITGET